MQTADEGKVWNKYVFEVTNEMTMKTGQEDQWKTT